MNDRLRDALAQLNSDVPEVGVWEEIQGRVTARRRRNRAIQGALGLIAVLAIGLGASGLLRGTEGPDFVEQPTTTTVEAPTTTVLGTTSSETTVVDLAIEAVDITTIDGPVWAAYVFVGSDVELPEAQDVRTALGRLGITRNNGLLVEALVGCDVGIPEELYESSRNQFIAVYFTDQGAAFDFAARFPTTSTVAEVEHVCAPEDRLTLATEPGGLFSPLRDRVYALSPWYTVDRLFTVAGHLNDGESVLVAGKEPEILEEAYFETQVALAPGLNEIEVSFTGYVDAVETLQITYLPDATRQFAFADTFSGEFVADYAEFLTGEAANEAAREAGEIGEGETVPNDYFISNVNPMLRSLAVAQDAPVYLLGFDEGEGGIVQILVDRDAFEAMFAGDFNPADWYGGDPRALPYWLIIDGDTIVQIEQQYLP